MTIVEKTRGPYRAYVNVAPGRGAYVRVDVRGRQYPAGEKNLYHRWPSSREIGDPEVYCRQLLDKFANSPAEYLDSLDGDDAAMIRECNPAITVSESPSSGSTYVYLDSIKSRISDHPGGKADEIAEELAPAEMVARWLADARAE